MLRGRGAPSPGAPLRGVPARPVVRCGRGCASVPVQHELVQPGCGGPRKGAWTAVALQAPVVILQADRLLVAGGPLPRLPARPGHATSGWRACVPSPASQRSGTGARRGDIQAKELVWV